MWKNSREKVGFILFLVVVAVFLFVAPFFLLPQIYAGREGWLNTAPPNSIILELWEIDTFEGGTASRAHFLEKQAYLFQTRTLDTYILVRELSVEQAKTMLEQGATPDLVSFGIGAGDLVQSRAQDLSDIEGVRADVGAGGIFEGERLAVPWCMGGYLLCASTQEQLQSDTKIITGYAQNVPNKALTDVYINRLDTSKFTQYTAYEEYLKNPESTVLLGTQRDFYRLNNRVKNGSLDSISYEYLADFTDLVQYIAVTATEERAITHAREFVEFLVSSEIQNKLTSIGMFSVNGEAIYNNEYADFERALNNKLATINVFTSAVKITELQNKR